MSHSQRLRLGDVRAVYLLVGECRELGTDARAWRGHFVVRASGLLHARIGIVGEFTSGVKHTQTVDYGWDSERARSLWFSYLRDKLYVSEPVMSKFYALLARYQRATYRREQFASNRDWYRSITYNEYLVPAGIDDCIQSSCPLGVAALCGGLVLFRARGQSRFTPRACRLVHLLHGEVCRETGRSLATTQDLSPSDLSPRLRQMLHGLLDGDGEKQLASRFGLSRDTVHEYVQCLYRRVGVNTRAELIAHFFRRASFSFPE